MEHLVKIETEKDYNGIINFKDINLDNFLDFDYYRIVNPITKEVFSFEGDSLVKIKNYNCYDIWNTGQECKYCVSSDALVSSTTKRKLEQIDGTLFLAKVFPIEIENKILIMELFQNIGDSYIKTLNENIKLSNLISQMNDMASIEAFSGLYSHGFMFNKLMEISRANVLPVSLICMDIDNMKYLNDTFGHFSGDQLIKTISNELIKLKKENIFPGRTGGDEFQVIFFGYEKTESLKIAKIVLNNLSKIFVKDNYWASVSWAIGERENNQTGKEFMNTVDKQMYEMKKKHHLKNTIQPSKVND